MRSVALGGIDAGAPALRFSLDAAGFANCFNMSLVMLGSGCRKSIIWEPSHQVYWAGDSRIQHHATIRQNTNVATAILVVR